jgi:hypothetical protein
MFLRKMGGNVTKELVGFWPNFMWEGGTHD